MDASAVAIPPSSKSAYGIHDSRLLTKVEEKIITEKKLTDGTERLAKKHAAADRPTKFDTKLKKGSAPTLSRSTPSRRSRRGQMVEPKLVSRAARSRAVILIAAILV